MEYRLEKDSLGEVKVPADKLWGAQTQRSFENFRIGTEQIPPEMVEVFGMLKRAAAVVNKDLGVLESSQADAIIAACDELLAGKLAGNFPLSVWQTGSGTQFNMNINEVLAHRAQQIATERGTANSIHPNDHVNRSQSSNDIFPTSLHVVGVVLLKRWLLPALNQLENSLAAKSVEFADVIKIGRTHLMDATPLTLGQEISGWVGMLKRSREMIETAMTFLYPLAMGGTAVGTGINCHPDFGVKVAAEISRMTVSLLLHHPISFMP